MDTLLESLMAPFSSHTLTGLLKLWLEGQLLLGVGLGYVLWLSRGSAESGSASPRQLLRMLRGTLVLACLLPALLEFVPGDSLPAPAVQVWSGTTDTSKVPTGVLIQTSAAGKPLSTGLSRSGLEWVLLGLTFAAGLGILRTLRQRRNLHRQLEKLPSIRRLGRTHLVVSDEYATPFSCSTGPFFGPQRWVVLPSSLLTSPTSLRIAIAHELQHHRQGDLDWLRLEQLVQAVFFMNPVVRQALLLSTQLQEFVCDDALIGHRRVAPQAYGRCLLEAAELALSARRTPAGTTGMATALQGTLLKRRLRMILSPSRSSQRVSPWLWVVSLLLLTTFSFGVRAGLRSQTVTKEQLQSLYAKAPTDGYPLVINDSVVAQLNRYLSSREGRRYLRTGLEQLPEHRATVEKALQDAGLPVFLAAVPFLESGYRNLPQTSSASSAAPGPRGAGMWMFIPATAREYGLTVTDSVDERMDMAKETQAAIRLFKDLYGEFGDWNLALAGYNQGSRHVNQQLAESGTRDAWKLVEQGRLNDYLASFAVVYIVMQHPELLD